MSGTWSSQCCFLTLFTYLLHLFTVFITTDLPLFSFWFACKTEVDIECCLETLNKSSASQVHITQAMSPGRNCHQNPRHSKPIQKLRLLCCKRLIFNFLVWGAWKKKTPFMTPSGVGMLMLVFVFYMLSRSFVFWVRDQLSVLQICKLQVALSGAALAQVVIVSPSWYFQLAHFFLTSPHLVQNK